MISITSREVWGAQFGRGDEDPGPESEIVIHHSYRPALTVSSSRTEEIESVRSIERYHVLENGWSGIGYNWLIAPSGRVFEGRGWKYRGAHAGPINSSSIGICLLIDGSVEEPSIASILAVRALIREGLMLAEVAPRYNVSGHRDHMAGRTCPGAKVYSRLQEFRHDAIPPASSQRPNVQKIADPELAHVIEIARVRRTARRDALPGILIAEVLARAVASGNSGEAHDAAKSIADALADYIKAAG